ncbi:MAG: hypothetical protein HQL51_16540 [Magnetococcales bacterium]|nr:hypothetical protein [Magnetococcales bacterium]
MELILTWKRMARIWWAFTWRNLLAIVLCGVVTFLTMSGLIELQQLLGWEPIPDWLGEVVGFGVGLTLSVFVLRMVLRVDFGKFRIALLSHDAAARLRPPDPPPKP